MKIYQNNGQNIGAFVKIFMANTRMTYLSKMYVVLLAKLIYGQIGSESCKVELLFCFLM